MLAQIAIKNGVPLLTNYFIEKGTENKMKRIHQLETQRINKIQLALSDSPSSSTYSSTKGSTIKLSKGFLPKESIEDLGRRKWSEYHNAIDSLPENASQVQVHNALKQIVDNIKVFPCLNCRENAIKNMKKYPLLISSIKTKREAQQRICGFHNTVNEMLDKPITHNCDLI